MTGQLNQWLLVKGMTTQDQSEIETWVFLEYWSYFSEIKLCEHKFNFLAKQSADLPDHINYSKVPHKSNLF